MGSVRKKNSKIQNSLNKLNLPAKKSGPLLKGLRPVLLVFLCMIFAIPQKFKLIFTEFEAVNSSKVLIEGIQRFQVFWIIRCDLLAENIIEPKGIVELLIGDYGRINQF